MGQFTRSGEEDREREREEEMGNLLGLWRGTGRGRMKWAIYIILQIKYPQIIVFLCFFVLYGMRQKPPFVV